MFTALLTEGAQAEVETVGSTCMYTGVGVRVGFHWSCRNNSEQS